MGYAGQRPWRDLVNRQFVRRLGMPRIVVVLTALEVEYRALRRHLEIDQVVNRAGTLFEVGRPHSGRRRVAIAVHGEGNHTAAIIAERAIATFAPVAVLFVGIAGALHQDLRLGDVVVATRVYSYQGGAEDDDGFHARPRAWEAPHWLEQRARLLSRGRWLAEEPGAEPPVHFRPIAAGEVVVMSRTARHRALISGSYGDAAAIDMEGAGVARAAHLNGSLPTLIIRGISDPADRDKSTLDGQGWQQRAANNAAAFALALIADLPERAEAPSSGRVLRR